MPNAPDVYTYRENPQECRFVDAKNWRRIYINETTRTVGVAASVSSCKWQNRDADNSRRRESTRVYKGRYEISLLNL